MLIQHGVQGVSQNSAKPTYSTEKKIDPILVAAKGSINQYGSVFFVFIFFHTLRFIFRCLFAEKKLGNFGACFLQHAEIWLLSGLHPSDATYFSFFFGHVHRLSSYRAFVNFTSDQYLRNHLRNHNF